MKIKVVDAASPSIGVDTLEDLERVRALVERETQGRLEAVELRNE